MGVRAVRAVLVTVAACSSTAPGWLAACDEGAPASPYVDRGSFDASAPPLDAPAVPDGDAGGGDGCAAGVSGAPPELGCTGLYSDWASKTIAAGVEAYAPAFVFWDDGASIQRWIALPAGTQIDTSDPDEWTFPVGTRIWQELTLALGDAAAPVRIETRFMWKSQADVWVTTTYRWSSDGQTSAPELPGGAQNVGGTSYEVPSRFECITCHFGRVDRVLGFEAVSLSAPDASGLTMQQLVSRGLVTVPPASLPQVPGNAVESTALAWLHSNCGTTCHNRGRGPAGVTGQFLRLDVSTLTSVQTTDAYKTGWNTTTTGWNFPDASTTYRILACDPADSATYYRASVRDREGGAPLGTQMPTVLTHAVDDAGLAALAAWIDEGCDGGP
jgi:hypothetical protein